MFVGVDPRNVGDPWGFDASSIGGVNVSHRHVAAFVTAGIIVTLLGALGKTGGKRGIAALCIGGGEATALAIEMM